MDRRHNPTRPRGGAATLTAPAGAAGHRHELGARSHRAGPEPEAEADHLSGPLARTVVPRPVEVGPALDGERPLGRLLAGVEGPAGRVRFLADHLRAQPGRSLAVGLLLAAMIAGGWWLGRPASARPIDDAIPFAPGASSPGARSGSGAQAPATAPTLRGAAAAGGEPVASTTGDRPAPATPAGPPSAPVVVHVTGAVARPGIVDLPSGRRVVDAVQAAGGAAADADLDQLNLAVPVVDGMQIRVPHRGETLADSSGGVSPPGAGPGSSGGPVNLNQATAQQLDQLPGIGPSLAAAIVTYRQRHGRFARIEDLLNVPGIGPAKLADLRGHVSF